MIVFGGASKDGAMCNDAYALDISTWTWRRLAAGGNDAKRPSPRAGACAAPLPHAAGIVVCCGAEASETGLVPRADVWTLTLDADAAAGTGDASWTRLLDDDARNAPKPRNAATLSVVGDNELLLHGGWHPFKETFRDSHILTLGA